MGEQKWKGVAGVAKESVIPELHTLPNCSIFSNPSNLFLVAILNRSNLPHLRFFPKTHGRRYVSFSEAITFFDQFPVR